MQSDTKTTNLEGVDFHKVSSKLHDINFSNEYCVQALDYCYFDKWVFAKAVEAQGFDIKLSETIVGILIEIGVLKKMRHCGDDLYRL